MSSLHEEYRPRTWADVAGQPDAVAAVQRVLSRGWGGRAWWLTGASGTGKTTLAKLIAAEGATEFSTEELDAGSLTPAKLRELERLYAVRPLAPEGKAGWCLIVNECHGLRKDTVRAMLDVLERLPEYVVWVFTTTRAGQRSLFDDDDSGDCAPLVSRCVRLDLDDGPEARVAFAKRARTVAQATGLDGLPAAVYLAAVESQRGNLRAVLQLVESGQLERVVKADVQRELRERPVAEQDPDRRAWLQAILGQLSK